MSIQNKKLYAITERILKEEIKKGNLPSSKEFLSRMNIELNDKDLSMPEFNFKAYRATEIASSTKYNQDNNNVYNDLSVLYSNIVDVNNTLDKYFTSFGVEKEKIETKVNKLESNLVEKIKTSKKGGFLGYTYDTFDDTNKVSMDNSKDIFVDTKSNETRIIEEKNTSKRIIPNGNYEFNLLNKNEDVKETVISDKLSNIFLDDNSLIWQKVYNLKKDKELKGCLSIELDKEVDINKIFLDFITIKEIFVKIDFSIDGKNWYDLPYHESYVATQDNLSLDFSTMKMKFIKIYIEKPTSDEQAPEIDNYDYQFLFGIKNISLYHKNYPTVGSFQSNELDIQNKPKNYQIDNLRLIVDEYIPTGTTIDYSVGIFKKDRTIDWQRIDPMNRKNPEERQNISFSNIKRNYENEMFFPDEFSIIQSEAEDLRANGMPIYRLSNIQDKKVNMYIQKRKIVDGSLKLFVGKNSWEITSFPSDDVTSFPDIEDWKKINPNTEIDYIPLENTKSGIVFSNKKENKNKKFMCKLGVFIEDKDTIIKSYPVSTDPISIYMNGEQIFNGKTSMDKYINFIFKTGWNEIVVFINGENSLSVNGISASLGFNPYSLSSKIYSSTSPLKEISTFDLQYNTKMNNRNVFSKRETDNGIEILINFGKPGMKFDLVYDYSEDINEENDRIVLKADFYRENSDTIPSPKLKYYRIEFL